MLPPRLIRRMVLAPLGVVIALALAVLFPLLALVTVVVSWVDRRRPRRTRALRLLFFALVWLFAESAVLFMCLGLWLASGFGGRLRTEPFARRHYAVMRWFLDAVYDAARRAFGLHIEVEEPPLTEPELAARLARPVIVLSRHAGPGDSFLLVRQLLSVYQRRPRVVMKASLQLDPGIDVVVNRLPNVFVNHAKTGEHSLPSRSSGSRRAWTSRERSCCSRRAATGRLAAGSAGSAGSSSWAGTTSPSRARQMPNLLAPRSGGAFAAILACPQADVIFVAHAGLDRLVTAADVWRHLSVGQEIRAKWWRIACDDVPRDLDHEAQLQWLYDWWEQIDEWISREPPSRTGR